VSPNGPAGERAAPAAGEAATPTGVRGAFRLIATRRFGPYFFGNALGAIGIWFHNLAAALLIFRLTGSEALLGVLAFAQFIPTLVLVPLTGGVADRFDRRRVLLCAQLVATALAAVLSVLAALGAASVAVVLAISLALGVAYAFTAPAGSALIASLVEPRDLGSAVALNSMTFNLARAIGPVLAALVVTTLGIAPAFAVNAASYLVFGLAVMLIRTPPIGARRDRSATRLRDTLAVIRGEPRLGAYLVIVMIVGFASDPINTLSPAFAHAFGRPDTDAGIIVGAFGAGAVLAALVLTGRVSGSRRRLGTTLLVLAAGISLFSVASSLGVGLAVLVVAGFAYLSSNTAATSRLQLEVEEAHRGRIMALWAVAFLGLRPFASLLDGALASLFGVRVAGVVLALPALVAAIGLLAVPRLARSGPAWLRRVEERV
jgi:MFS family permease